MLTVCLERSFLRQAEVAEPTYAGRLVDMYYIYIIKSNRQNWHYVGFTSNVDKRLKEHNSGQNKSTKSYKPFTLIYVQSVKHRSDARDLEKYLKVRYNKEQILKAIS